jgi:CMP/dCMP kinase
MSTTPPNKIIIAIDGYSSCGKSTMAKQLAAQLAYTFIDSGAMYRAIALYFIRTNVNINNQDEVKTALQNIKLSFIWNERTQQSDIYLNEENIATEIRELSVASKVSAIAAIAEVRSFAVAQQQAMGKDKGIVMDGRDIGTVVFPNAELKIFVTAAPEVRVQRRYQELIVTNLDISIDDVRKNLEERDYIDTHRKESPLVQARDAILLDNSNLNRTEQLALVMAWANEKIKDN